MKDLMTTFPWDSIPHFSPSWADVAGKAHLYSTARKRCNGEIVKLCGIGRYQDGLQLAEPLFLVRDSIGACCLATEQLCGFVL
jgi:hypothetical protein